MIRLAAWFATPARKLIAVVVLAVTLWALAWLAMWAIGKWQNSAAKGRVATAETKAATGNARDAVDTLGKANDREAQSETITRENDNAIRNAPGAGTRVDPGVRDAGLDGLCRRAAYRNDPKCLQRATPR